MKEFIYNIFYIGVANAQNEELNLVTCGNTSLATDKCTIGDIFGLANNIGVFSLTVLFPIVFFIGLFISIFPLLRDPNVPANRAQAKSNAMKVLIGSLIMVGAYAFVKILLATIGTNPNILKQVTSFFTDPILGVAYAADKPFFSNPLDNVSVQNVLGGIINFLVFLSVIGIIIGIVRGVMLLLLGQENPENIKKGKTWIIYSLIIAAIVFGAEMIYNIIDATARTIPSQ